MSINPFKCEIHNQSWHLLSESGENLCSKCCQTILTSRLESDLNRRDLLSQLDSSLRSSDKLAKTLSQNQNITSGETYKFIDSMICLVYSSDPNIRELTKNCLNLLITKILEQKEENKGFIEKIFDNFVENLSADQLNWNESSLDLMAELMEDICVDTYRLKDDINILFQTFQRDFNFLEDNRLKTSVLKLFNTFYLNLKDNQLFAFDNDFHSKTLLMVFNTFDGFNNQSNDKQLVFKSFELLKSLSKFESILKTLTTDQKFMSCLNKLLNGNCPKIKTQILELFNDILDNDIIDDISENAEYIRRSLATTLDKQMMDSFSEQLISEPSISKPLLECILLVLDNIRKPKSEIKLKNVLNSVIISLVNSVDLKDDTHFPLALSVLTRIIRINIKSEKSCFTEFQFFKTLDLLEFSLSKSSDLFVPIVGFCVEFFAIKTVPILIPTQRMRPLLTLILDNINNNNNNSFDSKVIQKTIFSIKLIHSFLSIINEKKRNEMSFDKTPTNILNAEKQWDSNDFVLEDLDENQNSDEISKRTEIFEILYFCLQEIEKIFAKTLKQLISRRYLEENSELFIKICLCFEIIIENDLFSGKDLIDLIIRMFSKGYVLSLLELFWFCDKYSVNYESDYNHKEFDSHLSSLLSYFLFKIQYFEKNMFKEFEPKVIQKELIESKEKFSDISVDFSDYIRDETNRKFVDTFFAINYYCHKFLSNENYKINERFNQIFLKVLNIYLRNGLSDSFPSILTIKYSLFLCSFCRSDCLEEESLEALQQFFRDRDDTFYSKYYTNHIKLMEWLFSDLKCDKFCEFALKKFLKDIPDSYKKNNKNQEIYSFFKLIDANERAVQILIDTLFDTKEDNSTIDFIHSIIEDSQEFLDECHSINSWQLFYDKLREKISEIVEKLVKHITNICDVPNMISNVGSQRDGCDDWMQTVSPDSMSKVHKLLTFLCQVLSNEINDINFDVFGEEFNCLIEKLCLLIDKHLDESILQIIFKFFRLCLSSERNSMQIIDDSLTESLLKSKIGVTLLFRYVDNDLPITEETKTSKSYSQNKETALYLFAYLSKNSYKCDHNFIYESDLNRIINLLNSESKVVTESAFILLTNSFKTESYLESNQKSEETKIDEMIKLMHCLQNAVFRRFISLPQISLFFGTFFSRLQEKRPELLEYLAKSQWFRVIIDSYLEADEQQEVEEAEDIQQLIYQLDEEEDNQRSRNITAICEQQRQEKKNIRQKRRQTRILRQEFIDFVLIFFELDFVNIAFIEVINEMTQQFIQIIQRPEDKMSTFILSIKEKLIKVLKTILCGVYNKHLTLQNSRLLVNLFQKDIIINISDEHNYCHNISNIN